MAGFNPLWRFQRPHFGAQFARALIEDRVIRLRSKSLAIKTNYLILAIVAIYLISQLGAQFVFGDSWIKQNLYLFLAAIQIFIIFMPAVFFVKRLKLDPVVFLRIRKITVPEAFLILLMIVTANFIASFLNTFVVFLLELAGSVKVNGIPVPANISDLWIQILVIALLPSICEEFFFRGIIYRVFESMGSWKAIGISAFYFALFHFDIRNLLGPLFLGMLIAWCCYRTGTIFAGVIAHFVNNLTAVLAGWFSRDLASEFMSLTWDTMRQMFAFACFLGIVLLILLNSFKALTEKKVPKRLPQSDPPTLSILLHWPVCFFYGTYLIICIMFVTSICLP